MKTFLKNTQGIALLTVIILSSVILMLAVNVTLLGISSQGNVFYISKSGQVFVEGEGCVEEALLQLKRNADYTGGALTAGSVSCTAVVSGTGSNRTVAVIATAGDFTRDFALTVQIDPAFAILNWDE
jgi:hypothetical protein